LEDSPFDVLLVRLTAQLRDHLAEQDEREIGVMPALARRQHLLGLLERRKEVCGRFGELERLPDVARDLALQPRAVGKHAAEGEFAARGDVEVGVEPILEVEPPFVA
jgi:hypothetical protein